MDFCVGEISVRGEQLTALVLTMPLPPTLNQTYKAISVGGVGRSEEYKQVASDRKKGRRVWSYNSQPYSRCKGGKRSDLGGIYFRSAWEANIARYLNFLIQQDEIARWEFEPVTFEFHAIKRGIRSYTPDFRVWNTDGNYEWWEVKGWMDSKSKTKLRRFAKYYPEENDRLTLVGASEYNGIAKYHKLISPHWET